MTLKIIKSLLEQPREVESGAVFQLLTVLFDRQELIMSALSDLQAAVQAVQTAVTAAVSALGAATYGGVAPADVETAVTALNNAAASLNNAVTPPAAAPAETPAAS